MSKTTPPKTSGSLVEPKVPKATVPAGYADVRSSIVELLNAARQAAARNVNALMTASYWEIGRRIVEAEQKGKRRAGYGEQLIERLSLDLTHQFGRGFSRQNLQKMRMFFEIWGAQKILQTPSGESRIPQTVSAEFEPGSGLSETASRKLTLTQLTQTFPLPWSAYLRLLSVKDPYVLEFSNLKAEFSESH
jgi:hypothetical protein